MEKKKTRNPLLLSNASSSSLLILVFILSLISFTVQISEDEEVTRSMFPHDFFFGTATSAYQIEGAYLEDGKGLSNWDVFTHIPGNVPHEDNGDMADDHYHRYMDDIEMLDSLGVNSYRFSISWSRILPKGRFGEVNPSGVMFYNSIIDNLLHRGIEPFVTIHHVDIPFELEDRYGSWLNSQMQDDFVYFAKTCFEKFGDRVKYWITINEPNIYATMAYMLGSFPPGHCSPPFGNCSIGNSDLEPLISVHNMLIAHAKAVKLYREQFQTKQGGTIGLAVHAFYYEPFRDDEFSLQAVERALAFGANWILDPLIYGDYPPLMRKYLGNDLPKFNREEAKLVKGSIDFIGINHYSTLYAVDCFHHSGDCDARGYHPITGFTTPTGYRDGVPIGKEMGYELFFVVPNGMEKLIDYLTLRYPSTTFYITENGYTPRGQAMLEDYERIKYHKAYLASLARSMRKGAKVKGYFAWTLMDNFEWLQGYDVSYGLFYVNWTTLERIPKLSTKWYTDFLANKMQHHTKQSSLNSSLVKNIVAPTSFDDRNATKMSM